MTNETKIALTTGSSHGIGLEVVRQLAQKDFTVILTARNTEKGQAALEQLQDEGLEVIFKPLDVSSDASVKTLASKVEKEFGRLDVLVNNAAGYVPWGETPSNADLNTTHDVFETTLFGAWRMVQAFLPLLKQSQHGRIVNVSSGAGSHGDTVFGLTFNQNMGPSYSVSKAALNALTVKMAIELKDTGILVNAVCPGFTATAPGMEAMGARPVNESAIGLVWAATLPDDGPTGGFFRDGQPLPW
jgi:NAD(P)-dependent dehydrogenase (short-subunit alcohol dehydrogenase family)